MQRIEKKEGHSEATAEESSRNKASIFYWILRFAQYDVGFIVTSWRLSLRGVCCACFGNLSLSFIKPSLRGVQRRGNLSLMIMLLLLVSNQALAQTTTCSAPPSCSALGFDKGVDDCSGQAILRCPFDQSKVFCAGIVPGSGSEDVCKGICARVNGTMYRLSEEVYSNCWEEQADACSNLTTDDRYWFPIPTVEVAMAFAGKTSYSFWIGMQPIDGKYPCYYNRHIIYASCSDGASYTYCVTTY